jgi:CheY-like chemotaxis protein
VLLVDDDEDVRDSLALVLRDEGYHVETASNGKEALEKLDRMPPPGVVLLDLMMPVMNGWKTLEQFQARKLAAPVLVVSAAVPPAPPGAAGFLRKPVDLECLLERVDAAFARA